MAESHAVRQIPRNSCQEQRTCPQDSIIISCGAQKIVKHSSRRCRREYYEKPPPERPTLLKLTKGDPWILSVNKIQKPFNESPLVAKAKRTHCPGFCYLVCHIDAESC